MLIGFAKLVSLSGKTANQKKLSRRRAHRHLWTLERLEDRIALSGTPWGDRLATSPAYGIGAETSAQVASNAQLLNFRDVALDSEQLLWADGEAPPSSQPRVATDPSVASDGHIVPAPFWRKTDGQPTFAPDWYANQDAVTREVYYDPELTPSQNGALLAAILSALSAGEHVRIHAGTYSIDSFFTIRAAGTADRPVTIEGAPGEEVVLTRSNALQNAVNIDLTDYLILQGVTIRGGSTGLKLQTVNNFMLYDVEIWDTANNAVAANSKNTSYLYFIDNHIHDTGANGEGFYLGAHDGSFITHHTYVVGNYIHDLNAPDVVQGDGIEIKDGSYAVTVKYNFIANTNYPGINVYRTGRDMADRNLIEENVVLNSNDNGIQAVADAVIRNNLVVTGKTAFDSKPFFTEPENLTVVNNTFVAGGVGVKITGWGDASIVLANNAIYSDVGQYIAGDTGNATTVGNVLVSDLASAFANLTLDGAELDATPADGAPLIGAASETYLPTLDLNGQVRASLPDTGAVDYPGVGTSRFDFGTDASPLAPGYLRVTDSTFYSSAAGYGWLAGVLGSRDRGGPDDLHRDFDFVYSGAMSFAADLPAGVYRVTIVSGDEYYGASGTAVFLEGVQVDTFSRAPGEYYTKTYQVEVSDGQLTLTLGSGSSGGAVLNALDIAPLGSGAAAILVDPTSGLLTSESGGTASFTVALNSQPSADVVIDLSSSNLGEGTVSPSQLIFSDTNWNQSQTVVVSGVDDDVVDGDVNYSIILAAAQSDDPAYDGLDPADVSVTNTDDDKLPAAGSYDFGTDASPLAPGYLRVTDSTFYSSAAGYGWLAGVLGSRDRGGPDDLHRDFDFVYSGAMSFAADLPAGVYRVTIVSGDEYYGASGTAVFLEGVQVDTFSRAPGEYYTKTYQVAVSDGQLTLTLGSGSSGGAVLNALGIEEVA